MNKSLVCYFSASGTTKNVAESLAQTTGSDLFEIEPVQVYTDEDLDWTNKSSRTTIEMNDKSDGSGATTYSCKRSIKCSGSTISIIYTDDWTESEANGLNGLSGSDAIIVNYDTRNVVHYVTVQCDTIKTDPTQPLYAGAMIASEDESFTEEGSWAKLSPDQELIASISNPPESGTVGKIGFMVSTEDSINADTVGAVLPITFGTTQRFTIYRAMLMPLDKLNGNAEKADEANN